MGHLKPRPGFGIFRAPNSTAQPRLDRATFAGVSPEEASNRLVAFAKQWRDFEDTTANQKRVVLKRVLQDFVERGKDLGSLTTADLTEYRAYLWDLVDQQVLSQNYASHLVRQWNAAMRVAFEDASRPGEGLILRGFKQSPRRVQHLTEQDFAAMVAAIDRKKFRSFHEAYLFRVYLELEWCCGARIGSLNTPALTVADVDWDQKALKLRQMKNVESHEVVLSDRCLDLLRTWVDFLNQLPMWQGPKTTLLLGPRGVPPSDAWLNRCLKHVATLAGVPKLVSSHVLRKSAGTLMARENPKLAQEQLGVTWRVFNEHYNQPLLEDRLARRDILPGARPAPDLPNQKIGKAYLLHQQGLITKAELDRIVAQARLEKAVTPPPPDDSPGYA